MNKILFLSCVTIGIVFVILLLTTFSSNAYSESNYIADPYEFEKFECELMILDQWQPTIEGKDMVKKWLDVCIERGLITSELVELGASLGGVPTRDVRSAYNYADGDIEKTIQLLQDSDFPRNIPGHPDSYIVDSTTGDGYSYFPIIFVAIGVVIFSLYIWKKRE